MAKTIQITNTMPRMFGMGGNKKHPAFRLKPGTSKLAADVWDEVKKNKTIISMVERGELEEGETSDLAIDALPSKPSAAIKLIEKTLDLQTLREWAKADRPANVKAALEAQIKTIEAKAVHKGSEG